MHFRQVNGGRQDSDLLAHAIDLLHGSLPGGRFFVRKTQFPLGSQGNLHAVGVKCRSCTIKKTCRNGEKVGRVANGRSRDETLAMPGTPPTRCGASPPVPWPTRS